MKKLIKENELVIIIIVSMLLWGGTWTSAKMVADNTTKEVIVFWRFLVTFMTFIPVVIYKRESLKLNKLSLIQVILGTIFLVGYNMMFFGGLRLGLPGAGGARNSIKSSSFTFLVPTSALLFSYIILGEIPKFNSIMGGLLALIKL